MHLSELLSVRTIYHAHFKEPKILDISAILEAATIFIPLPFRVLLFSITWSSVAISNIRSVSNRFNAGIRLNVRWHSQNVALIPSAHEVHTIIFSSNLDTHFCKMLFIEV